MYHPRSTSTAHNLQGDEPGARRRRLWIVVLGLIFFGAAGAYFYFESDRYSGDDVADEAFPSPMQNVGR